MSQIAPGSYLGQAMNRIEENEQVPSSPSDSSLSLSEISSSDGRAGEGPRSRCQMHSQSKHQENLEKSLGSQTRLKYN